MTVGGVISGYWATGRPSDAMIPAMTMTVRRKISFSKSNAFPFERAKRGGSDADPTLAKPCIASNQDES